MLLTITTTRAPATDLGWLLHKHPEKVQQFQLAFGCAHVFYPNATEARCTAALVLDVDPIGLVRRRGGPGGDAFALRQYVNDRPYVASSLLSVALAKVYGSALGGRCADRPELVDEPLPLEARLAVLPCRGGELFLRRLFEPLGYEVKAERPPLDPHFPDWGESHCFTVTLAGRQRLQDLLSHLYVLIPVLDNDKHYWVGEDELEKLLRKGEGWLAGHPEREAITRRYLKHQRGLAREALARLSDDDQPDPDAEALARAAEEQALEALVPMAEPGETEPHAPGETRSSGVPWPSSTHRRVPWPSTASTSPTSPKTQSPCAAMQSAESGPTLNTQRLATVLAAVRGSGATSVLDLGCGEGKLLRMLLDDRQFERIVGMDVAMRSLKIAADRLRLDRLPPMQRARIELIQGALTYRDTRLAGFDAATCVEVIEHLDPERLAAFERVVFEFARPATVVVTTPNREYNVMWPTLPAGRYRHRDHRFEWTREEFETWARTVADRFGYQARILAVGPTDEKVGAPTQMGVFALGHELLMTRPDLLT